MLDFYEMLDIQEDNILLSLWKIDDRLSPSEGDQKKQDVLITKLETRVAAFADEQKTHTVSLEYVHKDNEESNKKQKRTREQNSQCLSFNINWQRWKVNVMI